MAKPGHLSVRGRLGALKVSATTRAGRERSQMLGVFVPRDASHERTLAMKISVASDVKRFAIVHAVSGGSIAVRDIELRTLIRAEVLRECCFDLAIEGEPPRG